MDKIKTLVLNFYINSKISYFLLLNSAVEKFNEWMEFQWQLKNEAIIYFDVVANPQHKNHEYYVFKDFKQTGFSMDWLFHDANIGKISPIQFIYRGEDKEFKVYYWQERCEYTAKFLSWMGKYAPVLNKVYRAEALIYPADKHVEYKDPTLSLPMNLMNDLTMSKHFLYQMDIPRDVLGTLQKHL
jgi:hypothetical protein